MNKISIRSILLAGLLFCSGGTAFANGYGDLTADCAAPAGNGASATTICINMGGSSAVTPFATQIPLDILDIPTVATPIFHYTNATSGTLAAGKLHVWTGQIGGVPAVIRYSATGSVDGYARLDCQATANVPSGEYSSTGYCGGGQPANIGLPIPTNNVDANLNALDFGNFTNLSCTTVAAANGTHVSTTGVATPVSYTNISGCSGLVPAGLPIHLGAADVDGSTFHQTGPLGTSVKPLDTTPLTVTQVSMFPFQFVTGNAVTYNGGATPNLTREQVVAIFSGAMTNWTTLPGYTLSGGLNGTWNQPVLCIRSAGSGTKATVQVTQMKDGVNEPIFAGPYVIFNSSTQNVINCVNANPNSIGYIDADQVYQVTNAGGHGITLDGLAPNEPTKANPKRNVQNGLYSFWVGERFTYRTLLDASMTAAQQNVINSFVADAQNAAIYPYLPAGAFWVSPSQMCVSKNSDGGPTKWTNPAPAGCPVP